MSRTNSGPAPLKTLELHVRIGMEAVRKVEESQQNNTH